MIIMLTQANIVSKYFQSSDMYLRAALHLLSGLQEWLKIFRQNGFEISVQIASQLVDSNDENGEVSRSFKKQRVRVRRIFDDEAEDERTYC